MPFEWDIDGAIEVDTDVEWDIGGVVERDAAPAVGGRTTKNTDPWALGQNIGQSFRMVT